MNLFVLSLGDGIAPMEDRPIEAHISDIDYAPSHIRINMDLTDLTEEDIGEILTNLFEQLKDLSE